MDHPINRTFILADHQDITRLGLECLIGRQRPLVRAPDVVSLRDTLRRFPHAVVVVDYALFDFESAAQLLNLKASAPESSWLLFSDELSRPVIRELLLKDPSVSIVFKSDTAAHIGHALQQAGQGAVYRCETAQHIINDGPTDSTPKERLTPSEQNILRQIAQGRSTKEIAGEMHLSFHTVNTHRKNIFRKIEVSNVQEAIRYAVRSGIADYTDYII